MKELTKVVAVVGILIVLYAIFSRFYGQTGVALNQFKSSSILLAGNTVLVLSLVLGNLAK